MPEYVIVETERGAEVWPNIEGAPITATFTQREAAELFVASVGVTEARIRNVAFNIASAFPELNYSGKPINPNGELVLKIMQIILADFPAVIEAGGDEEFGNALEWSIKFFRGIDSAGCSRAECQRAREVAEVFARFVTKEELNQ